MTDLSDGMQGRHLPTTNMADALLAVLARVSCYCYCYCNMADTLLAIKSLQCYCYCRYSACSKITPVQLDQSPTH